jgi:cerevisin
MKFVTLFIGLCAVATAEIAPLLNADVDNAVPNSYLVGLKPGATGLSVRTLNAGVQVVKKFEINDWRALHVMAEAEALPSLRTDANVKYVEVDAWSVEADCNFQDSGSAVWGLTRTSARELPDFTNGQYLFLDEDDGTDVNAYVVDTGIYLAHNDFEGRASHGMTASSIGEGDDDLNSHGTHVAGTIGGARFGVAKNANLIAVKVLNAQGSGSVTSIVEGVDWVAAQHSNGDNKKSVMNMSLGVSPPSDTLEAAVIAAIAAGVNTCVSARNNNRDACVDSPSRIPEAITCAASSIDDTLPSFTNYGPCVDIIAPGNNVLSCGIGSPDATSTKSGTSMSAPHAAGWVARYLSTFDDASVPDPADVQQAMKDVATMDEVILIPPKDTTPNQLLYAACD